MNDYAVFMREWAKLEGEIADTEFRLLVSQKKRELLQAEREQLNNESQAKNPSAVLLGRIGGLKGGKARAEKLTAEQRKEIARKAALARWNKLPDGVSPAIISNESRKYSGYYH